jgi:predicted MFS family arabinose efflux permease
MPATRVVAVAACAFVLEAALYSAATPLLPHFTEQLELSRFGAGTLAGAYPAGQLLGAAVAGASIRRVGVRRVSAAGFVALTLSTLIFGAAQTALVLDLGRFCQGVGAGLAWVGALAWLVSVAGPERRGQAIGSALGATLIGALVGPLLGTIAQAAGITTTYVAIALAAAVIGSVVVRAQPRGIAADDVVRARGALRRPPLPTLLMLNLLPGWFLGGTNLLVALRLDELGAGSVAIGATFLVTAGISAVLSPVIGQLSDRRGAHVPLLCGLVVLAVGTLLLAVPDGVLALSILTVVVCGAALVAFTVPVMAELNLRAEAAGVSAGAAAAILNLAFALGELAGAQTSGVAADLVSDLAALTLLAAAGAAGVIAYARVSRSAEATHVG